MESSIEDPGAIPLREELATIRRRLGNLPVLDTRGGDAVIGYDQHGLPF